MAYCQHSAIVLALMYDELTAVMTGEVGGVGSAKQAPDPGK